MNRLPRLRNMFRNLANNPPRWLRLTGLLLLSLAGLLFLAMLAISHLFDQRISDEIRKQASAYLTTEFRFDEADVTFFRHFPSLTLSFSNLELMASGPFRDEHLVRADELALGVNVLRLVFTGDIAVDRVILERADVQLKIDRFGRANYDVVRSDPDSTAGASEDGEPTRLDVRRLQIANTRVLYEDQEQGYSFETFGFDYRGRGGLRESQLRLGSEFEVDSVDVTIDQVEYLKGKRFSARSFTVYDTESFSIELNRNDISLNELDVSVEGRLDVFEEGLAYDFVLTTRDGEISDVVSVLPPRYLDWAREMKIEGDLHASWTIRDFSGRVPDSLAVSSNTLEMSVNKGHIRKKGVDHSLDRLHIDLSASRTGERLKVDLDSLYFELDGKETAGSLHLGGRSDSLALDTRLRAALDLDVLNQTLELPDISLGGNLNSEWSGQGVYQPARGLFPEISGELRVRQGNLGTRGFPRPLQNIEIDASLRNPGLEVSSAELDVQRLDFDFEGNPFRARINLKDFNQPAYDIRCQGTLDLTGLNELLDLPVRLKEGRLVADVELSGRVGASVDSAVSGSPMQNRGTLLLRDARVESEQLAYAAVVRNGSFHFENDRLAVDSLRLEHGRSRASLRGHFENYLTYALTSRGTLKGQVELQSSYLLVDEFIPRKETLVIESSGQEEIEVVGDAVIPVPDFLDLAMRVRIDSLDYENLRLEALEGDLAIREGGLWLSGGRTSMAGGTASIEGYYRPMDTEQALFAVNLDARGLDIEQTYHSLALFKELAPAAAQAQGRISAQYRLEGVLDRELYPVLPSLVGGGDISADDLQFEGYRLMSTVSRESGYRELEDPEVTGISIRSQIRDNVLNMERFRFRVRPFRLRMEGQTTLDGVMNFRLRIGLPPFGLIGIPVTIEGPSDNYTIRLGRKSAELEGLTYTPSGLDQEERRRMELLRDSIRPEMSLDEIERIQQRIQRIDLDSLRQQRDSVQPPVRVPDTLQSIDSTRASGGNRRTP